MERHLAQFPAALKTAIRAAVILRDDDGREVGTRPAEDYAPAHAWAVVKDAGGTLWFHHDQTRELLQQLVPPEGDEPGDAEQGEAVATLYKVNPNAPRNNVRANHRIREAVLARIENIMQAVN